MRKTAVITDSAASLPSELIERYHIFVVPMLVYVAGRQHRDGVDISPTHLYHYLRMSMDSALPKTSTPSVGDFVRIYAQAAQEAQEIVSVHLAAEFSAVYQTACLARNLVDAPIHVLDCRTVAMGCGFTVLEAARLAEAGADASTVLERAREIAQRVRVYGSLDTLYYLHRGGHVPIVASIASSALKICPILCLAGGQARLVELLRTRKRAVARLLNLMSADVGNRPVHAAVMHADALDEAEALQAEVASRFHLRELFITEFTSVLGAHTGPGLIGLAWWTED